MLRASIILISLFTMIPPAFALPEQSLEQLKAKAASARPEDRVSIALEIAERQMKSTEQAYKDDKSTDAQNALHDVVDYAGQARDAAVSTNKKAKNAEIAVRKMSEKLRDLKHTLDFEDQGRVQAAIDSLEKIRTDLLASMFSKGGH